MKLFGQLEDVAFEQLSADPGVQVQGRFFDNTTQGKTKVGNGVNYRAFIKNDAKAIFGNDASEANNIRIHKSISGVLQLVHGDDTTTEGTSATLFSQLSLRLQNGLNTALPANGNEGRPLWLTDQKVFAIDDFVAWRRVIPEIAANDATSGTTVSLAAVTTSVVRLTGSFSSVEMIPAGFDSQHVTLINRTGTDVVLSNESGATPANRIFTGTSANLVLKLNSALTLKYDITTSRWQVIGQAAGAGAGGGGVPNSSIQTVTGAYTILVTDDVILADSSLGAVPVTLPTPAGNLGKRLLVEKIGNRQNNAVTLVGTVNGIVNPELWALDSKIEIISTGSAWKTVTPANGVCFFAPLATATTAILSVGSVSTANVSLETLSAASATVIDNITQKTNAVVLLKNQSAAEENGFYTVPATNIVIAATATGNENIATLANGSVVNAHVCSTGEKVSLRFQTTASENGIYVIGATPGTTVRDTSQRHSSYTTSDTLKDVLAYADFYNFPTTFANLLTESIASHTNDLKFWKQTNDNLTSFATATYSNSALSFTVKAPPNASMVTIEICPFGGAGAGATTARGGAAGSGALPIIFQRSIAGGASIVLSIPLGSVPGTGKTGTGGTSVSISVTVPNIPALTVVGAASAAATGVATVSPVSAIGGPLFSNGGANNGVGANTYFATGGPVGTGGALAGGGGGAGDGLGAQGGNGANSAQFLGTPGVLQATSSWGSGGGGGGSGPASGRPGRGGFSAPGFVRLTWS